MALSHNQKVSIAVGVIFYFPVWVWAALHLVSQTRKKLPRIRSNGCMRVVDVVICWLIALLWPLDLAFGISWMCARSLYRFWRSCFKSCTQGGCRDVYIE